MSPTPTALTSTARLRALESEVRARNASLARDLWRMGDALREVNSDELWRAGGHESFNAWLAETGVTGRSTAYKAMRIARVFAEEMAVRFGTEKLDAGVRYLNATVKEEAPGDLLAVKVRVRDEAGSWTTVPFVEASARQIRTAATALSQTRRTRALPADLRRRVQRINREVAKSKQGFKTARVRVHRNKAGEVLVSLASVPLAEFDAYVAQVRAGLVSGDGVVGS